MPIETASKNTLSEIGVWFEKNKLLTGKIIYTSLFVVYLVGIPAWPLISTLFGVDKDLGFSIFIGVLVAQQGIFFSILSDIYDKGRTPELWFQSHQESLPTLRKELERALEERPVSVVWLGVSMQSAWLALEGVFSKIEEGLVSEVKVVLLPIHPDYCRTLPGNNDGLAMVTEGQMEYMRRRCTAMSPALNATKSEIIIAQYAYMPNFHGVLVNESTLFLSTVRWHGENFEELSVPREPYELIDSATPRGRYAIRLFNSWVDKCLTMAKDANMLFNYPQVAGESISPQNQSHSETGA